MLRNQRQQSVVRQQPIGRKIQSRKRSRAHDRIEIFSRFSNFRMFFNHPQLPSRTIHARGGLMASN
jgi:hypothetical protein